MISKGNFISVAMLSFLILTITVPGIADAAPMEADAQIVIPPDTPVTVENGTASIEIIGYFAMLSKTGLETLGDISGTLSITEGLWESRLSQTSWSTVDVQTNYEFTLTVTLPEDVSAGQSASYTITLTLFNALGQNVGSTTAGTVVRIDSKISGDDDDVDDDDSTTVEDESIPLWPFFGAGILIFIILIAIWANKNLEMVREVDGTRRIYFREKDTGRVIGKGRDHPPGQ